MRPLGSVLGAGVGAWEKVGSEVVLVCKEFLNLVVVECRLPVAWLKANGQATPTRGSEWASRVWVLGSIISTYLIPEERNWLADEENHSDKPVKS